VRAASLTRLLPPFTPPLVFTIRLPCGAARTTGEGVSIFNKAVARAEDASDNAAIAGVAMIAESAAQQLEDREAAFLVVRKLEELAQACGGLAPRLCEL